MSKKVSIVIPVYNREQVISRAIESVINQTHKNWELFVVDDGSTDRTKKIIEDQFLPDERIRLVERPENKPKGANACRNIGMAHAVGEYIAFLDSDDEWHSGKLEEQIRFLENFDNYNLLCYTKSKLLTKQGLKIKPTRSIGRNEKVSDYIFLNEGFIQTSSILINDKLANNLKFDESLQRHQDIDFVLKAERLGVDFVFLDKILVTIHWENSESLSSKGWNPEFSESFAIQRKKMFSEKSFQNFLFKKVVLNTAKSGSKIEAIKLIKKVDLRSIKFGNIARLIKYLFK